LRKTGAPPTPRGNEQRGPRAQAQVPSSTQEPQGGFSQATEKQKPRPESGRLAAGEEKRRTDQAAVEATKKAEEGVEKDGEKKDTDAKETLGYSASRTAQLSDDALYRSLAARPAGTLADARELREAWRGFLKAHPQSPWADQVRVRIIEASLAAWRLGGDVADREAARRDAGAYLLRADATQKERVRSVLPEIER
jgi:hypothetical protein